MTARTILAAVLLVAAVHAQQAPPYLFLRLVTPKGTSTPAPGEVLQAANGERIPLQICIKARSAAEPFEQPEIQAINQHPEYFRNRPPANITLIVQRLAEDRKQPMRFRVNSSGGGKDLGIYYVNADIDMLEEHAERLMKARQFVDWMASQVPGGRGSMLLQSPSGRDRLAAHFEEQYVNNPPGDYEIIARYTPTTPESWRGVLTSGPFRVRVVDAGDFFERMKVKAQAGAGG